MLPHPTIATFTRASSPGANGARRSRRSGRGPRARAEAAGELARSLDIRGIDPRRVRGHAQAVALECLPRDREMLVGRPAGAEVRTPEIDGVEAERAHVREYLVEPFSVRPEVSEV